MKGLLRFLLCAICAAPGFVWSASVKSRLPPYDSTALSCLVKQAGTEIFNLQAAHNQWLTTQYARLNELDFIIIRKTPSPGQPSYVEALEEKLSVMEALELDEENFQLQLLRLRYTKGLEFIKLIYEKVLSLDHHFTSLQTFQQVNSMANPNNYPAFQQNRLLFEERLKKKGGSVKIPALLQANPFISATFSIVSTLFSEGDNSQKEKDLEQISCILDFTVRMNADLNTIYYETEYLKQNNLALKEDCMALFSEYSKPIGYFVTLDKCRKEDEDLAREVGKARKSDGGHGSDAKQEGETGCGFGEATEFLEIHRAGVALDAVGKAE